eukprot:gene14685-4347_t
MSKEEDGVSELRKVSGGLGAVSTGPGGPGGRGPGGPGGAKRTLQQEQAQQPAPFNPVSKVPGAEHEWVAGNGSAGPPGNISEAGENKEDPFHASPGDQLHPLY